MLPVASSPIEGLSSPRRPPDAILAVTDVEVEALVYDDGSDDDTARIVMAYARRDPRVRYLRGADLPEGWCGKMHACHRPAIEARLPILMFVDADVRLTRDAVSRLHAFLRQSGAGLVSGFPKQRTGSFIEAVLIPLIGLVLLGFLPLRQMRRSTHPAFAAGIGQLFMACRDAYDRAGGHAAIRTTLHDGLELPRLFRKAAIKTDICDAGDIAECRMYAGAAATWRGLRKNATEGLGSPLLIVPVTLLLGLGQVSPTLLTIAAWLTGNHTTLPWALGAPAMSYLPRLLAAARFRESALGAMLHPLGIGMLLLIQWQALVARALGKPSEWRGRAYPA